MTGLTKRSGSRANEEYIFSLYTQSAYEGGEERDSSSGEPFQVYAGRRETTGHVNVGQFKNNVEDRL